MDETNFVDDGGSDLYIENLDESDEAVHGDGYNTPSDEAYGYMMMEDFHEHDNIDGAAYDKYIVAEVIMEVPGEGPRRATVRCRVEDLDGEKVGTYHCNPLMDMEYDDEDYDC